MPIHDWTRIYAGAWHAFHVGWLGQLQAALNGGRLPPGYYALAEQSTRPFLPDVLTLQGDPPAVNGVSPHRSDPGGVAVATVPPKTRYVVAPDAGDYTARRRTLTIRHASGDRIVALIEVLSPGNKAADYPFETFVRKAVGALEQGVHLLVVDLFPPTPRDPAGVHAAIWGQVEPGGTADVLTADEPLTLVSYVAQPELTAYVEPTAVGRPLIDMPLFLTPERYVNVPLEATYTVAYNGMPEQIRIVLDAPR